MSHPYKEKSQPGLSTSRSSCRGWLALQPAARSCCRLPYGPVSNYAASRLFAVIDSEQATWTRSSMMTIINTALT
ncbi:hypothetical protein [Nitrospira sp. KM1]|uniref:hypothetical protein n=1 Tax=Nitrospira sp. KM1 TaxID=1936990 RepID=UPI001565C0A5|nr:hypothetical protein [Nitrospira sp. KM1]